MARRTRRTRSPLNKKSTAPKTNAALEKALRDIEDCFGPEMQDMSRKSSAFSKNLQMIFNRWAPYRPGIEEIATQMTEMKKLLDDVDARLTGEVSFGHQVSLKSTQASLTNSFNKIAEKTGIDLRDENDDTLPDRAKAAAAKILAKPE